MLPSVSRAGLFVAVTALVLTGRASGDAPQAKLVALNRAVTVTASGHQVSAARGSTIEEGSVVETSAGNTARLQMPDGTLLEVEQGTRFGLESFARGATDGRIHLMAGTIRLDAPGSGTAKRAAYEVVTSQARVTFRREKGYVTSSADQDVVTCLRCRVYDAAECVRNDYTVRDASTCLSLHDASVAVITRERGIQLQAGSDEAMFRTVVAQLGGSVAAGQGDEPWWKPPPSGALRAEPAEVALGGPGAKAKLRAIGDGDSGDIWWMSANRKVAVVDDVDPAGTCRLHAAAAGHTAVVAFDQLGRYVAVPIDVAPARGT